MSEYVKILPRTQMQEAKLLQQFHVGDITTLEKMFYATAMGCMEGEISEECFTTCFYNLPYEISTGMARMKFTTEFLILEIKNHEENLWVKILLQGKDTILWAKVL